MVPSLVVPCLPILDDLRSALPIEGSEQVIFWVQGDFDLGPTSLAQRLARKLNDRPPAWPLSDREAGEWRQLLAGWREEDPGFLRQCWSLDVDRVLGLIVFRHRDEVPPPPEAARASRREFDHWRDQHCGAALQQHLGELFEIVKDMIASVRHPVINGLQLGTMPGGAPLTRMLAFQYPDVPRLTLLLQRAPADEGGAPGGRVVVAGKSYRPEELLGSIELRDDDTGDSDPTLGVELDPHLRSAVVGG